PGTRVLGPECAGAMPRGKITHDGVRLPQHEAIVLEGRHEAVRVQAAVLRRIDHAELHAGIDALVGEPELLRRPQHLLDVDRVRPPPDAQHAQTPPAWPSRRGSLAAT